MSTNTNKVPDFLIRAAKTFIQAFVPVIIANIALIGNHVVNWDFADWKGWLAPILIAAVAAGISAVWNLIIERINAKTQLQIFQSIDEEQIAQMLEDIIEKQKEENTLKINEDENGEE